ncbi:antitoxin [Streptomyces griseus]|uniref:antitoxin n=1 Tax=Streptomyces griseus TaxID=1911 RepID=UPI0004CB087D|nr:antitoxin [Streptomyces griseus]
MGLLDSLKAKLGPAKDKVSDLAQQHGDKIDQGLDKAAKMVDEKTKGKYSDTIRSGTGKAKEAIDRIGQKDGGAPDGGAPGGGAPAGGAPGDGAPGGGRPGGGATPPPAA